MVALSLMLKSAVLLGSAQQLSIPVVVAASAIPPLTDTQVRCFQLQFQYHQVGVLFKCLMEEGIPVQAQFIRTHVCLVCLIGVEYLI